MYTNMIAFYDVILFSRGVVGSKFQTNYLFKNILTHICKGI